MPPEARVAQTTNSLGPRKALRVPHPKVAFFATLRWDSTDLDHWGFRVYPLTP
jgi:hypothetical protein